MVLGMEKFLDLIYVCIELKPLFVHGLRNATCFNTGAFEPSSDGLDGILRGSEDINHFFSRIVFTVIGRIVIRAMGNMLITDQELIKWKRTSARPDVNRSTNCITTCS